MPENNYILNVASCLEICFVQKEFCSYLRTFVAQQFEADDTKCSVWRVVSVSENEVTTAMEKATGRGGLRASV